MSHNYVKQSIRNGCDNWTFSPSQLPSLLLRVVTHLTECGLHSLMIVSSIKLGANQLIVIHFCFCFSSSMESKHFERTRFHTAIQHLELGIWIPFVGPSLQTCDVTTRRTSASNSLAAAICISDGYWSRSSHEIDVTKLQKHENFSTLILRLESLGSNFPSLILSPFSNYGNTASLFLTINILLHFSCTKLFQLITF